MKKILILFICSFLSITSKGEILFCADLGSDSLLIKISVEDQNGIPVPLAVIEFINKKGKLILSKSVDSHGKLNLILPDNKMWKKKFTIITKKAGYMLYRIEDIYLNNQEKFIMRIINMLPQTKPSNVIDNQNDNFKIE